MLLIFDISGGEIMIIMLFALLFFGSKGIPDIARTLGRTIRQVRDASNEVQREIRKGVSEVEKGAKEVEQTVDRPARPTPRKDIPDPPSTTDPA